MIKIPCFVIYKDKKYTKEEFRNFLQEGDNHVTLYNDFKKLTLGNRVEAEQGEEVKPITAYHVSNIPNITEFKTSGKIETAGGMVDNVGVHFTPDKGEYKHKGDYEYTANLNIKNPYVTEDQKEIAIITPERADQLKTDGYDGVVLMRNGKPAEYVVFDSKQIEIIQEPSPFTEREQAPEVEQVIEPEQREAVTPQQKSIIGQDKDLTGQEKEEAMIPVTYEKNAIFQVNDDVYLKTDFGKDARGRRNIYSVRGRNENGDYVLWGKANGVNLIVKPEEIERGVGTKRIPLTGFVDAIDYAQSEGLYQQWIKEGRMTAADAITIMESANIFVPKEIRDIAEVDQLSTEQIKEEAEPPIPPEVPPIEIKEKPEGGETKIRGAQRNALLRDETEQQRTVKEIVKNNQEKYQVLHGEAAVGEAQTLIDELGFEGATLDLEEKTRVIDDYPKRQVARLILLDAYSRVLGDPMAGEVDKNKSFTAIDKLQTAIAREGTVTGQGNAMLQIWTSMQPSGVLQYVLRKTDQFNQKKLNKKRGGDTTIAEDIGDLYDKLTDENKRIVDEILGGKDVASKLIETKEPKAPPNKRFVPKEKIRAEKDYRKKLLDNYKKSGKTISASLTGLTSEQIELGGNLIGSYIREGYWQVADIIAKLKEDFKSIGIRLTDEQTNELLTRKKDGTTTFRSWLRKQEAVAFLRDNMKDAGLRIKDIVRRHWSERDELGRTLAQKFIDEVGLDPAEAQSLEKLILDEYQKRIKETSEKELTRTLGTSKLPTKGKNKTLLDKMFDMLNMGALDTDMFSQLFAEKFGLAPKAGAEQMAEIMRLANVVQQTKGMGWIQRDATIDLTKYIYELYPQGRIEEMFDTWIALAYANMLSGMSTSVLNLWSAGSNIALKPVRDVLNLSKWFNEIRKGNNADGYNPFGEMVYVPAFRGMAYGAKEATEIYRNGDLNNKYLEQITTKSKFYVVATERNKYGKAARFKPWKAKIAGKTYDFNIMNLYKYAARNLSAQDKMMLNTSYDIEIASILRDVIREQEGLQGRALTKRVMEVYKGTKLNWEELRQQVENDAEKYEQLSGKVMTPLQKKIRLKELERAELPLTQEQKNEAERLARSNIFTDDRGGLLATAAQGIGYLSNRNPLMGVIIKPFVPFTKIVGNVGEYMFDHVPLYGFMRANGLSLSRLKGLIDPTLPTAQMGKKGSKAYYEQMGRAYLGTTAFGIALALFLGTGDDDFLEITGGYSEEGYSKRGRENVMPKYTLRIGKILIPYMNIPSLAIPLAIIGNINDGLRSGVPEDELMDRLTATLLIEAVGESLVMIKDMTFVEGIQNMLKMFADVASMEAGAYKRAWKTITKSYIGFLARPMPQNNNLVQQIWKIFDPTSYSSKELKSMLSYAAGIQHFVNLPNIDQLGDTMETYPGETLLPYTHWLKIKGTDERWRFLAEQNAIPNKISNSPILIETSDGLQQRILEEKELYDYTFLAGQNMSRDLESYMSDKEKVAAREKEIVITKDSRGNEVEITGIQDDVQTIWEKARRDARTALFYWGVVKEEMPQQWAVIKENKAYMPYASSKKIDDVTLNKSQLYRYNSIATTIYAPMAVDYINSDLAKLDKKDVDEDTGKSYFQIELEDLWKDALKEAEDQTEDLMEL